MLLRAYEWALVSISKYKAGNNMKLKAKLYRDIALITLAEIDKIGEIRADPMVVTTLSEFIYPMKLKLFLPS